MNEKTAEKIAKWIWYTANAISLTALVAMLGTFGVLGIRDMITHQWTWWEVVSAIVAVAGTISIFGLVVRIADR